MSSKLQDINKAVKAYQYANTREQQTFEKFVNIDVYMYWLISLLAVQKAAQAMRAEIKNIPQTVMTYHMYDVVADYDKAAAKLEGE